ncbi:unnamed protein product [Arctia plantaginis]|uniref:Major facilitator superfamily (MFS) profile domain-containing protein n=1 Tax=Arctia plantaginis TaxID=874455 RepID=A0A8S0YR02_ARCPL|nr:unnamed protein product [Arctia plantaginis]
MISWPEFLAKLAFRTRKISTTRSAMSGRLSNTGPLKASADKGKGSVAVKPLELDDVLTNELGQFGRYQLINILLIAIPIMMATFINEYVFSAAAIPHRCLITECGEDSKSNLFDPEWVLNAIPSANSNSGFSSCSRFQSQGNGTLEYCPADLFTTTTTDCNGQYVYARDNSIVYDFNLGCEDWLRALPGTLNSVGTLLALPFTGYLSDRFGRRFTLVVCVFNLGLIGLIRAFSVNYPMYVALQILQTTLGSGAYSTSYIFATEFVGPRYRVATSAYCSSMFALGQVTIGAVAWIVQPWRYMIMALHIPCFLVVSYYWLLADSVRWQLSKGKFAEAKASLETMARVNKKQISEKSMNALLNPPTPPPNTEDEDEVSLIKAIFKSRVLLGRVCTTPIWWITITFVYYGLSINSVGLSDTIYLNYILVCAVEIPGFVTAALILGRIGRKLTLTGGYFFSAACNIAFIFIPQDLSTLRLVFSLLGKFGISMVMTSLYLFTTELYPTQYRHSLLAFSSMVGRIGSITAPLTPVLAEYWHGIPPAMFAGMAILSGLLVLTQPETLGTKLPDTLEEAEAIGSPESMRDHKS